MATLERVAKEMNLEAQRTAEEKGSGQMVVMDKAKTWLQEERVKVLGSSPQPKHITER